MALRRPNIGDDNRERLRIVTPAKAESRKPCKKESAFWIPACAGMTGLEGCSPHPNLLPPGAKE